MQSDKKREIAMPGDKLAEIEELLPGNHVFDDSGHIRAAVVGSVVRDMRNMEVSVMPATRPQVLKPGDVVTGMVETAQTSSASVSVQYVNGKPSEAELTGSLLMRDSAPRRGARRSASVKLGDIVRCEVQSLTNGMIHLSLNGEGAGVVFARCSNCGRPLIRAGSRLKCDECGNVEERKLAGDYGESPIRP
jgi:exosome complex component CSL4